LIRNLLQKLVVAALLAAVPIVISCDTEPDKDPYIVINVNYSGTVNATNKLYIIFYVLPNWTQPWMILPYSSTQIVIPRLNIGTTPLYFEIVHDINGDGVGSGDLYQGWDGVTSMAAVLTPLILPETEMVMLNFNLDNNAAIP